MRATQRRLWRQCKNRGCPKAGSYRPSLRQGRVRNRHSCRKGNLHAPRHPWFWQRSVPRFYKATYPLAAGRPQKLPLLRQKNYPARQRKAGLPRNLDAEDEKPPMAGLMAAMGGLPMWRAEMTARPNHCFPARPRLCRGRFFDMYPPVVKLRRTFFASFSFFVESNLYEARGASAKLRRRRTPAIPALCGICRRQKGLSPPPAHLFPEMCIRDRGKTGLFALDGRARRKLGSPALAVKGLFPACASTRTGFYFARSPGASFALPPANGRHRLHECFPLWQPAAGGPLRPSPEERAFCRGRPPPR